MSIIKNLEITSNGLIGQEWRYITLLDEDDKQINQW